MPKKRMPKKRWSDLSSRNRKMITVGIVIEGVLKVIALADLARRPADQVRGSKAKWAAAVFLINSAGAVPLAYFLYGRRSAGESPGIAGSTT